MIPVISGLFALILFFFVFYMDRDVDAGQEKTRLGYLYERKEAVYDNLRDLNFEFKAGKFPEIDYQQMRASLEEEAAQVLAEISELENNPKSLRKGARV